MKSKASLIVLLFGLFAFLTNAQTIERPTLPSVKPTAEQLQLIRMGAALHDQKKYDEAIEIYKRVVSESPDCTSALYELSYSYFESGNIAKSMETAETGAKYISDELPLFYLMIANIIDDAGKPLDAIKIYNDAIGIIQDKPEFRTYLSSLEYNRGLTYQKLGRGQDAKASFKASIESNFAYASPHFRISEMYRNEKLRVPSVLAALRLVSLEFNTDRSTVAGRSIIEAFTPTIDPKTGSVVVTLEKAVPSDEGDFTAHDVVLRTLMVIAQVRNGGSKDEADKLAMSLEFLTEMLTKDKKLSKTFVGKNYIPFLAAAKKKGFIKHFAYLIRSKVDDNDAIKWMSSHADEMSKFAAWAKAYDPAA